MIASITLLTHFGERKNKKKLGYILLFISSIASKYHTSTAESRIENMRSAFFILYFSNSKFYKTMNQ